jgi:putative membrane protein
MRTRIALLVGIVALMLAPVCPAQAAAPRVSAQDIAYLREAHQGNLFEIAGGRLAARKAAVPKLRALGARLVRDHAALDARLTRTAARLGVGLPSAPAAEQRSLLRQYRTAEPDRFDALFVDTQLLAHRAAMLAGQQEIAAGSNRRVKRLAAVAAPVLEAHHTALRSLRQDQGYGTGGGRA